MSPSSSLFSAFFIFYFNITVALINTVWWWWWWWQYKDDNNIKKYICPCKGSKTAFWRREASQTSGPVWCDMMKSKRGMKVVCSGFAWGAVLYTFFTRAAQRRRGFACQRRRPRHSYITPWGLLRLFVSTLHGGGSSSLKGKNVLITWTHTQWCRPRVAQ